MNNKTSGGGVGIFIFATNVMFCANEILPMLIYNIHIIIISYIWKLLFLMHPDISTGHYEVEMSPSWRPSLSAALLPPPS